jgi:hypothetical protein
VLTEYLPKNDDWTAIPAYNIAVMIVARASNRLLVGKPLCRNMEYIQRCIMFTKDFSDSGDAIRRYPKFLKGYVLDGVCQLKSSTDRPDG